MEEVKKQILGFKDWDANKKGRAINRLKGEDRGRFTELPDGVLQAALDDELSTGQNNRYNTGAPLYSKTLAENLNMRAPYQQYVLYIFAVSACGLGLWQAGTGVRAMGRARELGRAAYLKAQGRPKEEWMNHVAEADATEVQLLRASNFISRQKAMAKSSFVAAVSLPLLWLSYVAYRRMSVQQESQQAQQ